MRSERCGNCRNYKPRTSECRYGGDVAPEDRRCYMYERLVREEDADDSKRVSAESAENDVGD